MKETEFNTQTSKHVILLPGLLAPVQSLFPLTQYLRHSQNHYSVTAVPLRLSVASLDSIVERAVHTVTKNLLEKRRPETIILIGHSHGGRVACELVHRLKDISPDTEFSVITLGSPIGRKLDYLPWYRKCLFSVSKAYRDWPAINQPGRNVVKRYVSFYSPGDRTVTPEAARADNQAELVELPGLSHRDLIVPVKIGSTLLKLIRSLNV